MSFLMKLIVFGLVWSGKRSAAGLMEIVVGETGECKFVYDNGTNLVIIEFGMTLPTIKDITKPGEILLSVNGIDVKNITNVTSNDSINKYHYIGATLKTIESSSSSRLTLILLQDFVDYEKNEYLPSTSINVKFECTSGSREIEFIQPIEDTNNNYPEFEEKCYVYTLPMPLPPNIALTNFTSIAARDIDLTNKNITFNLDPVGEPNSSGFIVSWFSVDRKLHYANLRTKAVIDFMKDVTFTLSATDTGIPPKTSRTNVTIKVDDENSILRFAQPLYTANLTNLKPNEYANVTEIRFVEGDVSLVRGAGKYVNYTIKDYHTGYTNNFLLKTGADDASTIQVYLVDPPKDFFLNNFVLLSVTARKRGDGGSVERTILHLSLPGSTVVLPETTQKPSEDCESSNDEQPGSATTASGCAVYVVAIMLLLVAVTADGPVTRALIA